jgi:nitric oxide reductase activation protein
MENRERDRVSQRAQPTEAGKVNRKTEEEKGRERNSGTSAEFGQKIGHAENLDVHEGGNVKNKNDRKDSDLRNTNLGNEPGRKSGSEGFGSSGGRRSGSMGSESDISREEKSPGRSGSVGNLDSSEGRR